MSEQEFIDEKLGTFWKWMMTTGGYIILIIFVIGAILTFWIYPADNNFQAVNPRAGYYFPRIYMTIWMLLIAILAILEGIAVRKRNAIKKDYRDNYLGTPISKK